MLREHHGFRGCAFLGDDGSQTVVTLWDTVADIEALERSDSYRRTVEAILATGFVLEAGEAHVAPVLGKQ